MINRTLASENPRSPRACGRSELQTPLTELDAGMRVRRGGLQWLCGAMSGRRA